MGKIENSSELKVVTDLLDIANNSCAERLAFEDESHSINYGTLQQNVACYSRLLSQNGIFQKRVGILLKNSVDFVVSIFSAMDAGASCILFNPETPDERLSTLFSISDPDLIITSTEVYSHHESFLSGLSIKVLIFDIQLMGDDQLAYGQCKNKLQHLAKSEDTALVLFSGGTTGVPKAVPHSHKKMLRSIALMEWGWQVKKMHENWLPVAPFFHIYGLLMGVLNPIYSLASVVIPPKFNPQLILEYLNKYNISVFGGGPPSIYGALLSVLQCGGFIPDSLYVCPGGGALFPSPLLKKWKEVTGVSITQGYGMTECAPIAVNRETVIERPESVGQVVPGTKIEICNADQDSKVAGAAIGEVKVKACHGFEGYIGTDHNESILSEDGWIYTGDVGFLDENGILTLVGRKKDVIIVKGFNVFPYEVENVLLEHPDVTEASVIGIKDQYLGEKVMAFVVTSSKTCHDSLASICKNYLEPYKRPSSFMTLDSLPKTPAGKINRASLAALVEKS